MRKTKVRLFHFLVGLVEEMFSFAENWLIAEYFQQSLKGNQVLPKRKNLSCSRNCKLSSRLGMFVVSLQDPLSFLRWEGKLQNASQETCHFSKTKNIGFRVKGLQVNETFF